MKKRKKAASKASKTVHFTNLPVFAVTLALLLSLVVFTNFDSFVPGITGAIINQPAGSYAEVTCFPGGEPAPAIVKGAGNECWGDYNPTNTGARAGDSDSNIAGNIKDIGITSYTYVGRNICKKGITYDRDGKNWGGYGAKSNTDYCVDTDTVHEYYLYCVTEGSETWNNIDEFVGNEKDFECNSAYNTKSLCADGACRPPTEYAQKIIWVGADLFSNEKYKFDAVSDGDKWIWCDAYDRNIGGTYGTGNERKGDGGVAKNIGTSQYLCVENLGAASMAECCAEATEDKCQSWGGPAGIRKLNAQIITSGTDRYKCLSKGGIGEWCGPIQPTDICGNGIDDDCSGTPDTGCEIACPDADGDGFSPNGGDCGPTDCDDDATNDPYTYPSPCPSTKEGCNSGTSKCAICINPGATENCADIVDNDCDGKADLNDTDCGVGACATNRQFNPILQSCTLENETTASAGMKCCAGTISAKTSAQACNDVGGNSLCNISEKKYCLKENKITMPAGFPSDLSCCRSLSCSEPPQQDCKSMGGLDRCSLIETCPGTAVNASDNTATIACCSKICEPITKPAGVPLNCTEQNGFYTNITIEICPEFNWTWTAYDNAIPEIKCCAEAPELKPKEVIGVKNTCEELGAINLKIYELCDLTADESCPGLADNYDKSASDHNEIAGKVCCKSACEKNEPIIILEGGGVVTETTCAGCWNATTGICLPVTAIRGGRYCDVDKKLQPQKNADIACDNNFECKSNVCSLDKTKGYTTCTEVREAIGLIYRIWYYLRCWIAEPVDADNRKICTDNAEDCGTDLDCAESAFSGL